MDKMRWTVILLGLVIVAVAAIAIAMIVNPGGQVFAPQQLANGYSGAVPAGAMLRVPVTGIYPGGTTAGLNPAMPNMYALFQAKQMLAVHAVGNLLLSRSHFASQVALELGQVGQNGPSDGWGNRLSSLLQAQPGGVEAVMTFGTNAPTIGQGTAPMGAFASSKWHPTPNNLAALIETLGQPDPLIGQQIESGFNDRSYFKDWLAASGVPQGTSPLQDAMRAAGIFVNSSGGPAVAIVETDNADTHIQQVPRLQALLADLDAGMALLIAGAGDAWANTVVLTMTEFGRAAAINGCNGTDHGTAFAMFLAGGNVVGGQVVADWPGLGPSQLYQGRDLAPTTDVRAVLMGVLQGHLGLSEQALATVFPNATGVTPMTGLVNG